MLVCQQSVLIIQNQVLSASVPDELPVPYPLIKSA